MFKKKITLLLMVVLALTGLLLVACGQPSTPTVEPPKVLTIETNSLADGQLDIIYSQTLKASGGSGSYTWSITGGALPAGFTLKPKTGGIAGTPGQAGTSKFMVQLSDGKDTVSKELSIYILSNPKPMYINTSSLDPNEVGAPYYREMGASGGSGKYKWSISAGSLPDGLSLNAETGVVSGRATREGIFGFAVSVEDSEGTSKSQSLNLRIYPAPVIDINELDWSKNPVVGEDIFRIVTVVGGTEQINNTFSIWTITNGSLPPGLSIDNYGDINGKPTEAGTFNFRVQVQDKLGGIAAADLSLTIEPSK